MQVLLEANNYTTGEQPHYWSNLPRTAYSAKQCGAPLASAGTWRAFSLRITSHMQCTRFSIAQCTCHSIANYPAVAACAGRLGKAKEASLIDLFSQTPTLAEPWDLVY